MDFSSCIERAEDEALADTEEWTDFLVACALDRHARGDGDPVVECRRGDLEPPDVDADVLVQYAMRAAQVGQYQLAATAMDRVREKFVASRDVWITRRANELFYEAQDAGDVDDEPYYREAA